jgi:hypothetical protein
MSDLETNLHPQMASNKVTTWLIISGNEMILSMERDRALETKI